jgi:(p)ppGpp synthase/HD superfamily hydrolase
VLRAAGWLHDLLEDTDATLTDMRMALTYAGGPFNTTKTLDGEEVETVIFLVRALTKVKGLSRREGNADYLAQIRAAGRNAVLLKVADRIANVEASVFAGASILRMYRQEQAEFLDALHRESDGIEEAWSLLRATLGSAP